MQRVDEREGNQRKKEIINNFEEAKAHISDLRQPINKM